MVFNNFKFGANFESNIVNKTSILHSNLHNDVLLVIPQYESNQEKDAIVINNINNFTNDSYNITSVNYIPFYEADDSSEYFLLNSSSKSNLTFINSDLTKVRLFSSFNYLNFIYAYDSNINSQTTYDSIDSKILNDIDSTFLIYLSRTFIVDVSVGDNYSLFLDRNGKVYSFGDNNKGQLGHGNTNDSNFPTLIDALATSNITHISAGQDHSLFLDKDGKVYSCGYNNQGQLGRTVVDNNNTIPVQITENIGNSNITHISAGFYYSLFLDKYGRVYSCGYQNEGQLGRTVVDNNNTIPVQITENIGTSNIFAISAGNEHSLFLDEYERVYSCGKNNKGQLGHGNINDSNFPTLIDALATSNITHISAGYNFSLFVVDSKNIYISGSDPKLDLDREVPYKIDYINADNIVNISATKSSVNVFNYSIFKQSESDVVRGNANNNSGYFIFKASNTLTFYQNTMCDILIVGGGGGSSSNGAGGAGGVIYIVKHIFFKDINYDIGVGRGGNVGYKGGDSFIKTADGEDIYINDLYVNDFRVPLISYGGGKGGGSSIGGSLGGGDELEYGTVIQGKTFWDGTEYVRGGHTGHTDGGGGGAGGAGVGTEGGGGRAVNIIGTSITYGRGGSVRTGNTDLSPDPNTGNGGNKNIEQNYKGSSGVVIIKYYKFHTMQFLYISSTILVESLPNTQNSIVTDTNNLNVWDSEKALIEYIDGFIIDEFIYLIHKSGKIITKLDTSYKFNESFDIDYSINIKDYNDVISITVKKYIYIIIGYLNKIIKFNINTKTSIPIEIENYYYTKKIFSKAIYSYIDNKIYLIPYNVPQLGIIDVDDDTFNFISLYVNDINIFESKYINNLFSDAIQYNQYIYMIPESSQYIYIYNILDEKVINVFDISIYNEKYYNKSYKFSSAFLSKLDKNFNNIVLIPNNSFYIGIITYDISDNNPNLDIAPNFNVISRNIFRTPTDDSEYYLIDNLDIDVSVDEIYTTDYKRGTTNFHVSNTNENIILQLKSNFPNITFTKHRIIQYKFDTNISASDGIFNLSNITKSSSTTWDHHDILRLDDVTNKIKYLNNSFSANKLSIAFTVESLPNGSELSQFFAYSNSKNDDGIVLKANNSNLEIQIQSLEHKINCSSDDKFVLIIDDSNITLYENTESIDLDNSKLNSNLNINNFDIFNFGSDTFNGKITNFNIFNINLNDNEISHLYNYDYEYIADLFLRNDSESFFNDIYQQDVNLDSKYTTKYPTINFRKDFITSNQINALFINNIYSIENNVVYFIPYGHKYILELNLDSSIIRQIDISSTQNNNAFLLNTFINNDTILKFNNSIILLNKLYLLPYSNHNYFLPLIIYDFDYDDTASVYLNVDIINISESEYVSKTSDLFCVFLYYYGGRNKYLLLIKNKSSASLSFNIENKNIEQINDTSRDGYIDGYIDGNYVYLLEYTGKYMLKYRITESGDSLTFDDIKVKINLADNGRRHTKRFSKMLFHNDFLYLIPCTEYRICKYNINKNNFTYIDIKGITSTAYNDKLFDGGAILKYNNKTYIIMIPFNHTALCIYNIDDDDFIFINDPIFKTNQFIGCCVDLKGNIYMNTYKGDVLYYSLSLVRQYNFISSPVVFGTTGTTEVGGTVGTTQPINTREISFKNLYKKFHKNYTYADYNFNNTQIKFSDYYNDGGAEYFTNKQLDINKFVTKAGGTISNVHYDNTPDLSYNEFVALQSEHCNELTLHPFLNITKNRCEYYTPSQNNYKINAVDILSTELYYSSTDSNYDVTLYKINNTSNNPDFCISIPFRPTSIKNNQDINIPGTISNKPDYDLLFYRHDTINNGITSISATKINELNIYIYSNIDNLELDLSNLIIKDIFHHLSSINITFDPKYVESNNLYIYNGINILMNTVSNSNKYLRSLNNITITIKNNVFFDNNDTLNKLIQISSNKRVSHIQTITILEDNNIKELYLPDQDSFTTDINNDKYKKINKITYKISDTDTNINLGDFSEFHYLKDIIIIINNSAYTLTISGSLKQKCNIIIFSNINDQSSSSAFIDDSPIFYPKPSLLRKLPLQELLPPIALPLQVQEVQATSLIYKFAYNPNVELPAESIFDLEHDDIPLPFFNQYDVDFNNNSDTFLKNDEINFTIKKLSFWFYLLNNNPDNHLLSLYNDAEEEYLTLMIDSTSNLVIKTKLVTTDTDITVKSAPIINNWYYIENLFNVLTESQQTEYTDNTKLLNKITLNLGNLQASQTIKTIIDSSSVFKFESYCKIGYLKIYKEVSSSENNFRKYLDFSESPVYQANFIQYKFNNNIEPEKNEYNESILTNFITNSESDISCNNYFIDFNSNINLRTKTMNVSCLSIWFNINKSDAINNNYLLIYKNIYQFKSLQLKLSYDATLENEINLHIGSSILESVYIPSEISGTFTDCPPKRSGHTMVTMNDKIYIFGGLYRQVVNKWSNRYFYLDDFYEIDITTDPPRSTEILRTTGDWPSKRTGHTMVVLNDKIYIFGGYNVDAANFGYLNDFYEIEIDTETNTIISCYEFDTTGVTDWPSRRKEHTMVVLNDKIYIFGGENRADGLTLDDFYEIEIDTGTKELTSTEILTTTGEWPSKRKEHTMVVLNDKIYIFGGEGFDGYNLNDFYEITLDPPTSTRIDTSFPLSSGSLPSARSGHTMVALNNNIYIFGGNTVTSTGHERIPENDFHEINVTTSITRQLNKINYDMALLIDRTEQDTIEDTIDHTMVVLNDKIYIFGGYRYRYNGLYSASTYFSNFYEIDFIFSFEDNISLFATEDIKWFNLVLAKNTENKYGIYIDNVLKSTLPYNTSDYNELEFNPSETSVIQNVKTADLRLYNELLIDGNFLSNIYYDNEILKYNSLRYRFGDNKNNDENSNSSYNLSESAGSEIIYNEYCVSFEKNGYLQLENSYNTELLSISFYLNTINDNNIYHLISLSNINNYNLDFFIKDYKLSNIVYATGQEIDLASGTQLTNTVISHHTWYNLMLDNSSIYIDNDSDTDNTYSLSLNSLRIGNNNTPIYKSTQINITDDENWPPERCFHTMVALNDKIYIYGGQNVVNGSVNYLDDFYEIDITTDPPRSTQISKTLGTWPSRRNGHTMVVLNDKIYIFGGFNDDAANLGYLNDFYEIDITTDPLKPRSTEISRTTGDWPSGRKEHTMVALKDKIYIFGGRAKDDSFLGDFYEIDITTDPLKPRSTEISRTTGDWPPARFGHKMVALKDKIYIFGGFNDDAANLGYLNDFYEIDITTDSLRSTEILRTTGDWPSGRFYHTMVALNDKIYIFGGTASSVYQNLFYEIDITTEPPRSTEISKTLGTWPSKGYGHTMIAMNDKLYIFGGQNQAGGLILDDLYEIKTTYDQFNGKIADLQLYKSEYSNTSIDRTEIYSNLLYYKP